MCNVTTPSRVNVSASTVKSPTLTLNPSLELSSVALKLLAFGDPATSTVPSLLIAKLVPRPFPVIILSLSLKDTAKPCVADSVEMFVLNSLFNTYTWPSSPKVGALTTIVLPAFAVTI